MPVARALAPENEGSDGHTDELKAAIISGNRDGARELTAQRAMNHALTALGREDIEHTGMVVMGAV